MSFADISKVLNSVDIMLLSSDFILNKTEVGNKIQLHSVADFMAPFNMTVRFEAHQLIRLFESISY
jgi:hypothetical protein